MAFVTGGRHFGQYTFEHWYDGEYDEGKEKPQSKDKEGKADAEAAEKAQASAAEEESAAGPDRGN